MKFSQINNFPFITEGLASTTRGSNKAVASTSHEEIEGEK